MSPKMEPVTPTLATPKPPANPYYLPVREAEKKLVLMARDDVYVFIAYVSGRIPVSHHIRWLLRIFDWTDPKNFRLALIAPRESAKSTIIVYAMAWFISRYPWKTNAIMSISADQAEKRLNMIRSVIETNVRYQQVFPWIHIDYQEKNTQTEFSLRSDLLYDSTKKTYKEISYSVWRAMVSRYGSLKDPTIRTGGRNSKVIIGGRISGIFILDDIIDQGDVNPTIQDEVYDYIIATLIPLLQENAKMIYIGTRWLLEDVPAKLMNNPAWHVETIEALTVDEATGELVSYWPEYWPVRKLMAKKAEMANDAMFEIQYMNNPRALAAAKFRLDSLDRHLPLVLPRFTAIYIGTDFAASLKQRADWTVYSAVAFDALSNIYILDMHRTKNTPENLMNDLGMFVQRVLINYGAFGNLTKILVENVNFQSWAEGMIKAKYPNYPTDLVVPIGDKGHRLEPLANKFNDGMGYINTKMAEYPTFKSEALNFPAASKDDTLDSVTIVLSYVGASGTRTANVKRARSRHLR